MRKRLISTAVAGVLLSSLALTGTASAATPPLQIYAGTQRLSLGTQDVQQLVDGGARIEVSSQEVGLHPADVRLFVYQRALNRGGATGSRPPASWLTFVSNLGHLKFTRAGTQEITLHIDSRYRLQLLHAGAIILGVRANGY